MPIEIGLAASLQARVLASLKIKEENEERQRRSELSYTNQNASSLPIPPSQIKTEGKFLHNHFQKKIINK